MCGKCCWIFAYLSGCTIIYFPFFLFPHPQIACVVHSNLVDGDSNTIIASDSGLLMSRDDMKAGFPLGEHFVDFLFNFCTRFNAFNLRDIETALFSSLVLISPGKLLTLFYFLLFFLHSCTYIYIYLYICSSLFYHLFVHTFMDQTKFVEIFSVTRHPSCHQFSQVFKQGDISCNLKVSSQVTTFADN